MIKFSASTGNSRAGAPPGRPLPDGSNHHLAWSLVLAGWHCFNFLRLSAIPKFKFPVCCIMIATDSHGSFQVTGGNLNSPGRDPGGLIAMSRKAEETCQWQDSARRNRDRDARRPPRPEPATLIGFIDMSESESAQLDSTSQHVTARCPATVTCSDPGQQSPN